MMFLRWGNGREPEVVSEIERSGEVFSPPKPNSKSFHHLSLPTGLELCAEPCGEPAEMFSEIISVISEICQSSAR